MYRISKYHYYDIIQCIINTYSEFKANAFSSYPSSKGISNNQNGELI